MWKYYFDKLWMYTGPFMVLLMWLHMQNRELNTLERLGCVFTVGGSVVFGVGFASLANLGRTNSFKAIGASMRYVGLGLLLTSVFKYCRN